MIWRSYARPKKEVTIERNNYKTDAEKFVNYLLPRLNKYTKSIEGYANEGIILFNENKFFDKLASDFGITREQVKSIFPIIRNEPTIGGKKGLMRVPDRKQLTNFYNQVTKGGKVGQD